MTKTITWLGKAAVLAACLAVAAAALVLSATTDETQAQKKKEEEEEEEDRQQAGGPQGVRQSGQALGLPFFPISVANADKLDGKDSTEFLAADGKAADSDLLDGKDSTAFFSGKTYIKDGDSVSGTEGDITFARVACDPGDTALSGGYTFTSFDTKLLSERTSGDTHTVGFEDNSIVIPNVTCADFPPLRQ